MRHGVKWEASMCREANFHPPVVFRGVKLWISGCVIALAAPMLGRLLPEFADPDCISFRVEDKVEVIVLASALFWLFSYTVALVVSLVKNAAHNATYTIDIRILSARPKYI